MIRLDPSFLFAADPKSTQPSSSRLYTLLPRVVQARLSRFSLFRPRHTAYGLVDAAPQLDRNDRVPSFRPGFVHNDSVSSSSKSPSPPSPYFSPDGLVNPDWKYINQGRSLLSTAVSEAHDSPQSPNSLALSRQLYIHALTYLLQAIPPDLTIPEATYIRTALPSHLSDPNSKSQQEVIHAPSSSAPQQPSPPSLLHRVLASTIIQIFLLFQLVLPYLKCFLCRAYQYERTHRVSERVLVASIEAGDVLGRRCSDMVSSVLWKGDRPVGEFLEGCLSWWIDGICGGVQEGVGVGMARIGGGCGNV